MNCNEYEQLLRLNDLSPDAKAEMEAHAAQCTECRMLGDLKAMALETEDELSAEASARWREAVQREAAASVKRPSPPWIRYAGIAAALIILAFGSDRISRLNLEDSYAPQSMVTGSQNAVSAPTAIPAQKSSRSLTMSSPAAETYTLTTDSDMFYAAEEMEEPEEAAYPLYDEAAVTADDMAEADTAAGSISPAETKIVKNASVSISTLSFDQDRLLIEDAVLTNGGKITSSNTSVNAKARFASLNVQVPAENLDQYLNALQSVSGRITYQSVTTEDITYQYRDTQGRLDSALVKRDRLRELMGMAENIDDLIRIEDSLTETQYTIDSLTGQLNAYDQQTAFSSVSISISEETPAQTVQQTDGRFMTRLKNGMSLSFEAFWQFLQNACLFLLMALPWLAVAAVIFLACKRLIRRNKKQEDKTK